MHSNQPLFCLEPSTASDYIINILARLNNFHKNLRERQSKCLNKVKWGQPVIPGKHASFTIDRKHRGTPNPYDTDPNTVEAEIEIDDATSTNEANPTEIVGSSVVTNSEQFSNDSEASGSLPVPETSNVSVRPEEPAKRIPSPSSDGWTISVQDEPNQKWRSKRLKLKKLSNKENQNGKLLHRRSLFKKSPNEVLPVLPSLHEGPDEVKSKQAEVPSLSDRITTTILPSLDTKKTLEKSPEEILLSPDSSAVVSASDNSSCLNKLSSSSLISLSSSPPHKSSKAEPSDKLSPLRENQPSLNSSCEVRSSSPVFLANDSPFRNSGFLCHLQESSGLEELAANNTETVLMANGDPGSETITRESMEEQQQQQQTLVNEEKQKQKKALKRISYKKTTKKVLSKTEKSLVQCPLCCEWFKPKLIEIHAANCGIISSMKNKKLKKNEMLESLIEEDELNKRKISAIDFPPPTSPLPSFDDCKSQPIRNSLSFNEENATKTSVAVVLPIVSHAIPSSIDSIKANPQNSAILNENPLKHAAEKYEDASAETKCLEEQQEIQTENSDLVFPAPIMKRCFICDLSYIEGKPFSNHLRSCRKNYQKLKRKFSSALSDFDEPKHKTRSRCFQDDSEKNTKL